MEFFWQRIPVVSDRFTSSKLKVTLKYVFVFCLPEKHIRIAIWNIIYKVLSTAKKKKKGGGHFVDIKQLFHSMSYIFQPRCAHTNANTTFMKHTDVCYRNQQFTRRMEWDSDLYSCKHTVCERICFDVNNYVLEQR